MGVEWAYFVLVSLEFASYHSDAKRALCDTQTFVKNDVFSPKKSISDNSILL